MKGKKNIIDNNIWNLHYIEEIKLKQRVEELIGITFESDYVIRKWDQPGKSGIFLRINKLKNIKNHSEMKEALLSCIQLIAKDNGITIT